MIRYFDSAYIARLYLREADSDPVRALAADLKAIACCAHGRVEVAVLNRAVDALEKVGPRADFEVYLKKFLQSLNLILPHEAGHRYRGPARRFGYILRMVKERYKDDSLDIADAGAKVKQLINEHLIDLGINPRIPPLCSSMNVLPSSLLSWLKKDTRSSWDEFDSGGTAALDI